MQACSTAVNTNRRSTTRLGGMQQVPWQSRDPEDTRQDAGSRAKRLVHRLPPPILQGNPECEATAEYFHKTITQMSEARNKFTAVAEKLAAKGLDVEPISNQLNELAMTALKKSRSHVHSFSRNSFQQVATPGEEAVQAGRQVSRNKAREEYKFRQVGLGCEHRCDRTPDGHALPETSAAREARRVTELDETENKVFKPDRNFCKVKRKVRGASRLSFP